MNLSWSDKLLMQRVWILGLQLIQILAFRRQILILTSLFCLMVFNLPQSYVLFAKFVYDAILCSVVFSFISKISQLLPICTMEVSQCPLKNQKEALRQLLKALEVCCLRQTFWSTFEFILLASFWKSQVYFYLRSELDRARSTTWMVVLRTEVQHKFSFSKEFLELYNLAHYIRLFFNDSTRDMSLFSSSDKLGFSSPGFNDLQMELDLLIFSWNSRSSKMVSCMFWMLVTSSCSLLISATMSLAFSKSYLTSFRFLFLLSVSILWKKVYALRNLAYSLKNIAAQYLYFKLGYLWQMSFIDDRYSWLFSKYFSNRFLMTVLWLFCFSASGFSKCIRQLFISIQQQQVRILTLSFDLSQKLALQAYISLRSSFESITNYFFCQLQKTLLKKQLSILSVRNYRIYLLSNFFFYFIWMYRCQKCFSCYFITSLYLGHISIFLRYWQYLFQVYMFYINSEICAAGQSTTNISSTIVKNSSQAPIFSLFTATANRRFILFIRSVQLQRTYIYSSIFQCNFCDYYISILQLMLQRRSQVYKYSSFIDSQTANFIYYLMLIQAFSSTFSMNFSTVSFLLFQTMNLMQLSAWLTFRSTPLSTTFSRQATISSVLPCSFSCSAQSLSFSTRTITSNIFYSSWLIFCPQSFLLIIYRWLKASSSNTFTLSS